MSQFLTPDTPTTRAARGSQSTRPSTPKKSEAEIESERIADSYNRMIAASRARVKALEVETLALERGGFFGRQYRYEQELIAQATQDNIPITKDMADTFRDLANKLADAEIAKNISEATIAYNEQLQSLEDYGALIGKTGEELLFAEQYQSLYNEAVQDGVIAQATLNGTLDEYLVKLRERATTLAYVEQGNRVAEFIADEHAAFKERMFLLERERKEFDLSGVALQAYRMETQLLVSAMREGIEIGPENLALIRAQANEYAQASEEIRKQREQIEFSRDSFQGFFQDMIGGLRQGQSVWEAFGNAVLRVMDRIIDKLLFSEGGGIDSLLRAFGLFAGAGGDSSSSGGGSFFGSLFPSAKGNAFNSTGHIQAFAKGGAFTNGLFDSPTLFKFAKGGAMGVMGEAGAEAVMPLKRGPDGSLGVQMYGPQTVRVEIGVNDDRFNAYVDERGNAQIAASAPAIVEGGARRANAQMAAQRRRSIV